MDSQEVSTNSNDSLNTSTTTEDASKPTVMGNGAPVPSTASGDASKTIILGNGAPIPSATDKDFSTPKSTGYKGSRTSEWFVPTNDIAREVIIADIQRYLGPDALVRPGQGTGEYEGQAGYWIMAYRCLTSQMIQDMRLDSQRWASEREPDQAGRSSVTAYQDSRTHAARQHWGPTTPADVYDRERETKPYQRPSYSYTSPASSYYSNYSSTAASGYYIASDGNQYPLTQQLPSAARARTHGQATSTS